MTHIKKLVMQGFKSFASRTEVPFDQGINVVVGPNGSGKSNLSDALCFVLGRISAKSMRAASARNLLFMGSKSGKPAHEASVEIVFDNKNNTFPIPDPEVKVKRIVRRNGSSIYKLNDSTRTRSEILETLGQAGIDPHGFNIILQGQIQGLVRMHPEERRNIIEEVAGISIYETRKAKSLRELEKTEERLKEIGTVLRERTTFLKNLERERSQALRYKELEEKIRRCKATLLQKKYKETDSEFDRIKSSIQEKSGTKTEIRKKADSLQQAIDDKGREIATINKRIKDSSGLEQETVRDAVATLSAEIEGLKVRKENFENRKEEVETRISQMQNTIPDYEKEISDLRKESPLMARKQEQLRKKKAELQKLEEEREKVQDAKTGIATVKAAVKDKENSRARLAEESNQLLKDIEKLASQLRWENSETCRMAIDRTEKSLASLRSDVSEIQKALVTEEKTIASAETSIQDATSVSSRIADLDVCPLCRNKMTAEHQGHVKKDSESKIKEAKQRITHAEKERKRLGSELKTLDSSIRQKEELLETARHELLLHNSMKEKQARMKALVDQEKSIQDEIANLQQKQQGLERQLSVSSRSDEKYNSIIRDIEEISSRTEKDLDTTLLYKERELENMREVIKRGSKDIEEIEEDLEDISRTIEQKQSMLAQREKEEEALNRKFKELFDKRDSLQETIQQESVALSHAENEMRQIEEQMNYLRIGSAKLDAEKEALAMELSDHGEFKPLPGNEESIRERLQKAQESLQTIGSINMRALELYDDIKKEYDKVKEKVDTLEKEKEDILKIISEIDRKKKTTFMKTFRGINERFTSNFEKLSEKGRAYLELQSQEDIFEGGVDIKIRLGKGKYFDVTSLSGGEQTLVALSLLFAIQEYKPYHFYIFDEIDAALDKRNSERLSALLKRYMQAAQYIVISHNDALVTDSNILYGVSMHEGISKILSLRVD